MYRQYWQVAYNLIDDRISIVKDSLLFRKDDSNLAQQLEEYETLLRNRKAILNRES